MHASQKLKIRGFFEIKTMVNTHTCCRGYITGKKKLAITSQLVKSVATRLVQDKPLVKPSEIIDHFRRECGITIPYYYAYKGKKIAIQETHGDDDTSYKELVPYVDKLMSTNPGTYVRLEVDSENSRFQRIFVSFEASIHGLNFCRPLLTLDGCHLKAKFRGVMLSATAKDGDGGKPEY